MPSENGSQKTPNLKLYVPASTLKSYLLLERRAILQSVYADERLIEAAKQIESDVDDGSVALKELVKKYVTMIRRNAEDRRKASLQIVRDTEKRYGIKGKKKRRK